MKNDGLREFFSIFKQCFFGGEQKIHCDPSLLDVCAWLDARLHWYHDDGHWYLITITVNINVANNRFKPLRIQLQKEKRIVGYNQINIVGSTSLNKSGQMGSLS